MKVKARDNERRGGFGGYFGGYFSGYLSGYFGADADGRWFSSMPSIRILR